MALLNGDKVGQDRAAKQINELYAAIRDLSSDINTRDATIAYQRGRISDLERNLEEGLHRNKEAVPLLLKKIEELKQDAAAAHKRASDRATQIENLEEKLEITKHLAQTNEDNRAKIAQTLGLVEPAECGECATAKELDECFTDLKKYKAFYDAHKQFVGLWNPFMDRQVIAPGAADFGGP